MSELENDGDGTSPFATEQYVSENGGKIDSISVNGTPQEIDENKNIDITVPTKYLSDATVTEDVLTITKQDGSTIDFKGGSSSTFHLMWEVWE